MTEQIVPAPVVLSHMSQTMTSREIAELTGKTHAHVMRDIRSLLEQLGVDPGLDWHCESDTYIDAQGKAREQYRLDRDTTLTLITGYDPVARLRIIKRWQELENSATRPRALPGSPAAIGEDVINSMMRVAALCKVPAHYALQVAGSEATRQSGMPWDRLLTQSEHMSAVPASEVMLEPTELGRLFGLSGRLMNEWLADKGLQERVGGVWKPTKAGAPHCLTHSWVSGSKSGYNLKWRAKVVEDLWQDQGACREGVDDE